MWLFSFQQVSTMEWDVASSGTLLYLTVTAVTVLLFTLGHYYIEVWSIASIY
jgi:hypothetical protein